MPGPRVQTRVDELLAWWNMHVFGRSSGASIASGHPDDSSVSRLTAQRKARESENN
ncbi:hypothetical protein PILCRDRAFT_813414 [Piloderma croceum F 1598]|uniref:Uncharacterized protein n=1 Tax=Piloderma croceum (strain F 1598) TaxID=765440 RepID=A0A0C3GFR9_PILCF|nr:hypothetical protein PILCRDRAFT_813414 [Piloderma croceum F 1598]